MSTELARCLLCCGVASQPQQLRCDHIFCRKCWIEFRGLVFRASLKNQDYHGNDLTDLLCPVCATVITVDEVSPHEHDDALVDFAARVELRGFGDDAENDEEARCEVCMRHDCPMEDQKYCVDCAQRLCLECGCQHLGERGHAVWQMPESLAAYCRSHGLPIESACVTCREAPLCVKCQQLKHSAIIGKHKMQTWEAFVEGKRQKLGNSAQELQDENTNGMGRSFQQLQHLRQMQHQQLVKTCAKIDLQADLMVRELDQQKQRLKESLLKRHNQVEEALQHQEKLLRFQEQSTRHLASLIALLSRPGQEAALLTNYNAIRLRSFNLIQRKAAQPQALEELSKALFFQPVKSLDLGDFQLEALPAWNDEPPADTHDLSMESEEEEEEKEDEGVNSVRFVWRVGLDPSGLTPTAQPHGLQFLQNGHLAVALYGAKSIQVYDDRGKLTRSFRAASEDLWPRDIAVLQSSNVLLVADSHTQKIRPFKMDAYTSKKDFGVLHPRHLFKEPTSIAVCHRMKRIVVSDTGNNDITVLNTSGEVQRRFGCHGDGDNEFDNPEFISVDPFTDRIIVSDCNNHCVKVYDYEGRFICKIGEHGQQKGQLSHPGGVVADDQGNIIVADGANNRVCVFSRDGHDCKILLTLSQHGIAWPYGIALLRKGLRTRIALTQRVDSSVMVFEYDQRPFNCVEEGEE